MPYASNKAHMAEIMRRKLGGIIRDENVRNSEGNKDRLQNLNRRFSRLSPHR